MQLYLLRFDWIKTLIKEVNIFDEDSFHREVNEKLKLTLLPELQSTLPPPIIENYNVLEPIEPSLVETKSVEVKYNKDGKGKRISDVVKEFLLLRKGTHGQKLLDEYKSICDDFVEIVGDIQVGDLSKETIRAYITTQIQLPPQRHKTPIYRDLSVSRILKMKDVKPQSCQNINK